MVMTTQVDLQCAVLRCCILAVSTLVWLFACKTAITTTRSDLLVILSSIDNTAKQYSYLICQALSTEVMLDR